MDNQAALPGCMIGARSVTSPEVTISEPAIAQHAGFQSRGSQAWFYTAGVPSDVTVEVDDAVFHLHKFPLISRSGKLARLIAEAAPQESQAEPDMEQDDEDGDSGRSDVCRIRLQGMPGGAKAFEQVARFCYGMKVELAASNVAALRCASEYLHMTEEYGEGNLVCLTESFLNHEVSRSWIDSVAVLQSCEALLPLAENLSIVKRCVDSIAHKACTDPNFAAAARPGPLQSPNGTLLWNGISTGARRKTPKMDWWYDDISTLSLPLFKRVIVSMEEKGLREEMIAGALMHYAQKFLPGLARRQQLGHSKLSGGSTSPRPAPPGEAEQVFLLETIEGLLPPQVGVASTKFLLGLLKVAAILNASSTCKASLERRIGAQLDGAALDDILIPNFSYTAETLYDVDCVQRLMERFSASERAALPNTRRGPASVPYDDGRMHLVSGSPSPATTPLGAVAKLLDLYLGEIAPDSNLKPSKFRALVQSLPRHARALDDGLYRAIDIFIKAHSWMSEEEREMLCGVMDCQKLSLEACGHAAQNERLPMRVVVQVLFMEQVQLRAAIMGCLDGTTPRNSAATSDIARGLRRSPPATHHHNHHRPHVLPGGRLSAPLQDCLPNTLMRDELFTIRNKHAAPRAAVTKPSAATYGHLNLSYQEGQSLRTDLVGLHCRIGELERECSRLRNRLRRRATAWASLSAKLTCRSISDISNLSGPLQHMQQTRRGAITQHPPRCARPRVPSASCTPVTSSSSCTLRSLHSTPS